MKLSTRQVDGVTIVDCSGRIPLGQDSVTLRDTVRDLLSKGNKKIVLNLAEVNYIDSSGIGELVSAFTTTKNQGGELKLLHLTKKVHDLLQITKLSTVFDLKDDEAASGKGFNKDVHLTDVIPSRAPSPARNLLLCRSWHTADSSLRSE